MFETKNVDNDKIEMFIESLIRSNTELFPENFDACTESRKKDFEITMYAIKKIMIELVERQKIDLSNVEYIASGCYSNVFRVEERESVKYRNY